MTNERCLVTCVHEEKIQRAKNRIREDEMIGMAKMFKVLADETRMKIGFSLYQEQELCVCDVANIIGSSVSTASHHLRLLRNMGLAKVRKEGKLVYYSLDDDHVKDLIRIAYEHQKEL